MNPHLPNNDPVGDVFGIPNLNLTILSHLATRDLTRATRVSKQWQRSFLSFAEPLRTLFLEPAPASGEYLDWLQGRDQRCYEDLRMWHPAERERESREEHERFLYATKHLGIQAEGVVATNAREVQIARRAIERARLFGLYKKLKAYKDQPFFAFVFGGRLV